MAYNVVRDKLTDYAVFKDGTLLLGTADIDLPSIEYLTDTIKGPVSRVRSICRRWL